MRRRNVLLGNIAALLMLLFAGTTGAAASSDKAGVGKAMPTDFSREPVAYMAEIFKNYHDWKVDEGIESAKKALTSVDHLYAKDVNTPINDSKLKKNRAFEIKSTLHTMLGMLYYRKALAMAGDTKQSMAPVLDKIKKQEKITEQDLEKMADGLDRSKANGGDLKNFHNASIAEFQAAIAADPANPVPHFQLGSVLSPAGGSGYSQEAEKAFFTAAKLSLNEGDARSVERATEALKGLNPQSVYLNQIEKLRKGNKHAG